MNLKKLKELALIGEWEHTDVYEILLKCKYNICKGKYVIELWKESDNAIKFLNEVLGENKYEITLQELTDHTYQKYEAKLIEDGHYDKIICGKCGKELNAVYDSYNFNPGEHPSFYCDCGCSYNFPIYLAGKDFKIIGINKNEILTTYKWQRKKKYFGDSNIQMDYVVLPCRPYKPCKGPVIRLCDMDIKKFDIIELIERRAKRTKQLDEDVKAFNLLKEK